MERLEVMLTGHSPLITREIDRKAGQGCRVYNLQNGRMGVKMGLSQQAHPRGPHSSARLSRDPRGAPTVGEETGSGETASVSQCMVPGREGPRAVQARARLPGHQDTPGPGE